MKKTLFILIAIFTLPAFAMERQTKALGAAPAIQANQAELNQQLINACAHNQIQQAENLLADGAEVNTQDTGWEWTPLMEAVEVNDEAMCEMLLEHGADVTIANPAQYNVLDMAAARSESLSKLLVSHALFNPRPSKQQRLDSQNIIFTILCSLKRVVPQLPKDVCYYMLNIDPQLRVHAHNCAFRMHRGNHELTPFLPFQVIRALVHEANGMLKLHATIDAIKKHKLAKLRKPMIDAMEVAYTANAKELLDPNAFDANFGAAITQHLTTKLTSN